ncbi:hypothetical protein RintRC_1377 [Richelia intracellularis]|nr:hypothetical protein RintRC_1377 [Richelia intracellularis]
MVKRRSLSSSPRISYRNHLGATLLVRRGVELREVLEEMEG